MKTLQEFNNLIEKQKKYYNQAMKEIYTRYEILFRSYKKSEMKELMNLHKNVILNILESILQEYKEFDKIKYMILSTGSLARNTNLLYSDIDFSFHYENKYKKDLLEVEDQIAFILSKSLSFRGRDRIHGITYYLPKISNQIPTSILENDHILHLKDQEFHYQCRENAYDTMINLLNSTRSVEDLQIYITSNYKECYDWTNCFALIKDNGEYNSFYKNIKNYEKENLKRQDILKAIDKLIDKIDNSSYWDDVEEQIPIRELKIIFKNETLTNFYCLLAIIYRVAIINNIDLNFIDLAYFDSIEITKQLKIESDLIDKSYYYLFLITRIQHMLNAFGLDLSSHSKKSLSVKNLDKKYKEMYNQDKFITFMNTEKKAFQQEIIQCLNALKEKI